MDTASQLKLPTFVGAGATKSGSSWLYANLSNHKDVYAPVKEVRYFTHNTDKGIDWYISLFEGGEKFKHCGEFTPAYLYNPEIPKLIARQLPWIKVIFILRNPVQRSYSQYKSNYYTGHTNAKSFREYLEENPSSLQRGYYHQHLGPWLKELEESNIKIFIFEEATTNLDAFRQELADFLKIDVNGFSMETLRKKQNTTNAPKLKSLFRTGFLVSQYATKFHLYGLSKFINRTGSLFFSFIGESKKRAPPMDPNHYEEIMQVYKEDIRHLSKYMKRNDQIWS